MPSRRSTTAAAPAKARAAALATPPADEATVRVLRQFRQVFSAVRTHFRQVENQAGVGGAQVWALSAVRDQPGIGVGGLAKAMDVRQPTASNLVRTLVELDLLEARKEGPDKRAVQLHLRPKGQALLRRAPGPSAGVLPQALAALDPGVLARLEADLAQLLQVLDADAAAARIPLSQM